MFCTKCGAKIEAESAFCCKCGSPVKTVVEEDKQEVFFQDSFKSDVNAEEILDKSYETPFAQTTQLEDDSNGIFEIKPRKEQGKSYFWLLYGVIVLIAIFSAFVWGLRLSYKAYDEELLNRQAMGPLRNSSLESENVDRSGAIVTGGEVVPRYSNKPEQSKAENSETVAKERSLFLKPPNSGRQNPTTEGFEQSTAKGLSQGSISRRPKDPGLRQVGATSDTIASKSEDTNYQPPTGEDLTDNSGVRIFRGHKSEVVSVAFTPDGTYALSGSDDSTLKLWNLTTGAEVRTFYGHTNVVTSIAISPNGMQALSGSYDKTLKLWNVQTGELYYTFTGHTGAVTSVAFSQDGLKILSGSDDKTVKLWNIGDKKLIRTFSANSKWPVSKVAFNTDGLSILAACSDGTVMSWLETNGKSPARTYSCGEYSNPWSTDGKYYFNASSSSDLKLQRLKRSNFTFAMSPDSQYVLCPTSSLKLELQKLSDSSKRTFSGHTDQVLSVAFSSDGQSAVSSSSDRTIRVWDVQTGSQKQILSGNDSWVLSVTFSPDGNYILSGSADGTVRFWDIRPKEINNVLPEMRSGPPPIR